MRKNAATVIGIVAVMILAMGSGALAAKGVDRKKPPPTTTTTTAEPTVWTCEARNENGADWILGDWDGTAYVAGGPGTCIDIDEVGHTDAHRWTVTWSGQTAKGTVRGLLLQFETEVHGTIHAEAVLTTTSGSWTTDVIDPPDQAFAFVAMPSTGDKWTSFQVMVRPTP